MRVRAAAAAILALALATAATAATAAPAQAKAGVYQRVQAAYERHGSVPPCMFSSQQLDATLKSVDTYGAQYFADFTNAVQDALAARASGECSHAALSARGAAAVQGVRSGGSLPTSPTSATAAAAPAPILLMGALALLGAVIAGALALLRMSGRKPGWTATWRHGLGEAAYRLEGRRAAGRDALRLRRRRR